jgi:hypothetical protein
MQTMCQGVSVDISNVLPTCSDTQRLRFNRRPRSLTHTQHTPTPSPLLTRTGWSSSSGRPSSFAIPFNGQCFRQAKHAGRMWLLCYSPLSAGCVLDACVPSTYSVCQLLCWMGRKGKPRDRWIDAGTRETGAHYPDPQPK